MATRNNGYLPRKLQLWNNILSFLLVLCLIVTIGVLLRLSEKNTGFAAAPTGAVLSISVSGIFSTNKVLNSSAWSLLWTVLPTFVLVIFNLYWGAIVSELSDRQPFVELGRSEGALGRRTILLDYRQSFGLIRWFRALQNRHWVLGIALALQLICSFALASLASHLFVASDVLRNTRTDMTITTSFNGSAFNSRTDIGSVLNLVSATQNLNASFPPWTLGKYAFTKFARDDGNSPQQAPNWLQTLRPILSGTGLAVYITGTDRGCPFRELLFVESGGATDYISSSAITNCTDEIGLSRLLMITGTYSSSSDIDLGNVNVISCIPSYWTTQGLLTVAIVETSSNPSVVSFDSSGSSVSFQWDTWETFEKALHLPTYLDPTAIVQATEFGYLAATYARAKSGSQTLTALALINATTEIFQSSFTFTTTPFLLQAAPSPQPTIGISSINQSRIFVVPYIAGPMLGILVLIAIWSVVIGIYSSKQTSILEEEPHGILGIAEIVLGSETIKHIVMSFRRPLTTNQTRITFEKFVDEKGIGAKTYAIDTRRRIVEMEQ